MKKMILAAFLLLCQNLSAQIPQNLESFSKDINKTLPEVFDRITKLITTTVDHNNLSYHFLLDVGPEDFKQALPKVKSQILGSICSKQRERTILNEFKANIVYRYENVKGVSLGEFMVKSDFCQKKK